MENNMGIVLTATNSRGHTSTYWVPSSTIKRAYESFDSTWEVRSSAVLSRKPRNVQYHIKERLA